MAIQINTDIETAEGFIVKPFCYLYIQMYNPGFSNCILEYYKSKQDFIDKKNSIIFNQLPNAFNAEITLDEFWGTELATVFHNKAIALIEETTGPGTCIIDRQ